jgi:antirestriction protein
MHEKHHESTEPDDQPMAAEHRETEPKPAPAIYVASLADYNNGVLHGAWINAAREPEAIQADIDAILASSREPAAEEWAIHDYDQFGHWRVGEYDATETVARIARGIAEHGYAFAAWLNIFDDPPDDFDGFHRDYLGHYASVQDYVEQMADDFGYADELAKLPPDLRAYVRIDFAAIARDMELSGEIATIDDSSGGVWIFRTWL